MWAVSAEEQTPLGSGSHLAEKQHRICGTVVLIPGILCDIGTPHSEVSDFPSTAVMWFGIQDPNPEDIGNRIEVSILRVP